MAVADVELQAGRKREAADDVTEAKRPCQAAPLRLSASVDRLRKQLDKVQESWNGQTSATAPLELPRLIQDLLDILETAESLLGTERQSWLRDSAAELAEEDAEADAVVTTALRCLVHIARDRLILMLLQSGRQEEAQVHLRKAGYLYRLSDEVLASVVPEEVATCDAKYFVGFIDDAIPLPLLRDLQSAFGVDSPYWSEHGYWSDDGFFSYEVPLASEEEGAVSHPAVEAARHVAEIAAAVAPHLVGPEHQPGYAEWWCHTKPYCAGHLLHFDQSAAAEVPAVSTVLYLSSATVGGSTLIINQTLEGQCLGRKGWLCKPKENRLLLFDGRLLHGVVPGVSPPQASNVHSASVPRRVTLMVALCKRPTQRRTREGSSMPDPSSKLQWLQAASSRVGAAARKKGAEVAKLRHPGEVDVWAGVDTIACRALAGNGTIWPKPARCFQGVTPWRKLPDRLLQGEPFE
eukprot:TRINITY_DN41654_c0_g1_i1.p1 TRINITY_DN41654_c0_g1~~TRINITY_DN41654_c0_g1_i1.p1  ORF type:complete len:476 (-),score=107.05 TRINITY_DN41654_c0_g1_i1:102-1490(-)